MSGTSYLHNMKYIWDLPNYRNMRTKLWGNTIRNPHRMRFTIALRTHCQVDRMRADVSMTRTYLGCGRRTTLNLSCGSSTGARLSSPSSVSPLDDDDDAKSGCSWMTCRTEAPWHKTAWTPGPDIVVSSHQPVTDSSSGWVFREHVTPEFGPSKW